MSKGTEAKIRTLRLTLGAFIEPNDQKLSHAAGDSRQPKTRSEN
jgi:hypothetical protein